MAKKFKLKIGEYLRNKQFGASPEHKKMGLILREFGVPVNRENLSKFKDLQPRELYKTLQKQTGKHGNQNFLDFAANKPQIFKQATEKYNLKYGAPSEKQLEKFKENFGEKANEYFKPDFEQLDKTKDEGLRRSSEDYDYQTGQFDTGYNRNVQDINRNKAYEQTAYGQDIGDLDRSQGYMGQDYATQKEQDALSAQIENENIQGDINSAGQFDSGIGQQRQARLAQQQGWRTQGIDRGYERGMAGLGSARTRRQSAYDYANQGFDTSLSRAGEDYNTGKQYYQRSYDRNVYDINDLYGQQQRNLEKQRQGYSDELLSGKLSDISNESDQWNQAQETGDAMGDEFLNQLYGVM